MTNNATNSMANDTTKSKTIPPVAGTSIKPSKSRGTPLDDVYCRGCHSRPSYKNINTYFCGTCWDRWNQYRRNAQVLNDSDVAGYKTELIDFIRERDHYVWQPEPYLYLRPIAATDLKRHNIKIPSICRDLRLFAPADDRISQETAQRVRDFAMNFLESHSKTPSVREVLSGTGLDHTTLWSCLDYEQFIANLGGKIETDVRYRFRDNDDFLQAAAQVVREAGCPLQMTSILEVLGVCYPAYLSNFKSVSPQEIHHAAGVGRFPDGVASLLEEAGRKALKDLGFDVEPQASFSDLVGDGGRLLHYDFRIVGTRTLVEIDGAQHYDPSNFFFKDSLIKYDAMKDDYAERRTGR